MTTATIVAGTMRPMEREYRRFRHSSYCRAGYNRDYEIAAQEQPVFGWSAQPQGDAPRECPAVLCLRRGTWYSCSTSRLFAQSAFQGLHEEGSQEIIISDV